MSNAETRKPNIVVDYTSSGYERESCKVCDRAIIRKSWMHAGEWAIACLLFEDLHKACEEPRK